MTLFCARGTVIGLLNYVAAHAKPHGAIAFGLRDEVTNRQIQCRFDKDREELLPVVLAAFEKRVKVHGRANYNREGQVVSFASVESIRLVVGSGFNIEDVIGIGSGITPLPFGDEDLA